MVVGVVPGGPCVCHVMFASGCVFVFGFIV